MKYPAPGRMKTVDAFRDAIAALGVDMACVDTLDDAAAVLGRPIAVRGRTLPNRFAIHPMEGWDGTAEAYPAVPPTRSGSQCGGLSDRRVTPNA